MRIQAIAIAAASLCAFGAQAATQVTFVKPESFSDMPLAQHDRDSTLAEMKTYLEKLGASLPASQDLKIEVLDIDLAGRVEPRGTHLDLRVLRGGADWPTIHLKYSVVSQGKTLRSGEERLSDMNYMRRFNRHSTSEPLRYEKRLLDEWFKRVNQGQ